VPTDAIFEIRDNNGIVLHVLTSATSYNLLDYNYGVSNSLYFKAPSNYPTYDGNVINLTLTATSKDGSDTASTIQGLLSLSPLMQIILRPLQYLQPQCRLAKKTLLRFQSTLP